MSWATLPGVGAYDPRLVALLLVAGIVAGFINSMAGGGSLLTLPALMLLGLPATLANGSNRLSIVVQSLAGAYAFRREGKLDEPALGRVVVPTLLGSALGAGLASVAPEKILRPVLLGTLLLVAAVLAFYPQLAGGKEGEAIQPVGVKAVLGLFAAGVYGGFIQAGVGFVLLSVLAGLLRYDLVRANALKLVCTMLYGAVALGIFVFAKQVVWVPAALLAVATAAGSLLGVRFAIKVEPTLLRRVVLVAVLASVVGVLLKG